MNIFDFVMMWIKMVHMHNINQTLGDRVTGALARKCLQVCWRALCLAKYAIVDSKPSEEYLSYLEGLLGWKTEVFTPSEPYTDDTQPLSLYDRVMEDSGLLEALRRLCVPITSYISTFEAHSLAKAVGSTMIGVPVEHLQQDLFERLKSLITDDIPSDLVAELKVICAQGPVAVGNHKIWMKLIFRHLKLTVPEGVVVCTFEGLVEAVLCRMTTDGEVFIRGPGDGGMGNIPVTQQHMEDAGCEGYVGNYLLQKLGGEDAAKVWCKKGVLVEEFCQLKWAPGVMFFNSVDGVASVLQAHLQNIVGRCACVGVIRHDDETLLFEELTAVGVTPKDLRDKTQLVAKFLADLGLCGTPGSVDFGVTADGKVVLLEVNARVTAAMVAVVLRVLLFGRDASLFAGNNDQLEIPAGTTLDEILFLLEHKSVLCRNKGDHGVVVTIEPHDSVDEHGKTKGSVGVVILAPDMTYYDRCVRVLDAISTGKLEVIPNKKCAEQACA